MAIPSGMKSTVKIRIRAKTPYLISSAVGFARINSRSGKRMKTPATGP
jgi:hypothetical protein